MSIILNKYDVQAIKNKIFQSNSKRSGNNYFLKTTPKESMINKK